MKIKHSVGLFVWKTTTVWFILFFFYLIKDQSCLVDLKPTSLPEFYLNLRTAPVKDSPF